MGRADEQLLIGRRGYGHTTSAITFTTSSTAKPVTDAVDYLAGPVDITTFDGKCRFVAVYNDDAGNFLTVTVGNTVHAPNAATAGHDRVYPRSFRFFQLEDDGQPIINVKADTASVAGAIVWFK